MMYYSCCRLESYLLFALIRLPIETSTDYTISGTQHIQHLIILVI